LAAFLLCFKSRAILIRIMNLTLNSKVALITADRAALARLRCGCCAAGAKVVFNYQAAKTQADDLVRECGAANCRAVQSDLSTTSAAQQLVASAIAAFDARHSSGESRHLAAEDAPIDRMSDEQWHRTIAVNVDSVSDWSSIR